MSENKFTKGKVRPINGIRLDKDITIFDILFIIYIFLFDIIKLKMEEQQKSRVA